MKKRLLLLVLLGNVPSAKAEPAMDHQHHNMADMSAEDIEAMEEPKHPAATPKPHQHPVGAVPEQHQHGVDAVPEPHQHGVDAVPEPHQHGVGVAAGLHQHTGHTTANDRPPKDARDPDAYSDGYDFGPGIARSHKEEHPLPPCWLTVWKA